MFLHWVPKDSAWSKQHTILKNLREKNTLLSYTAECRLQIPKEAALYNVWEAFSCLPFHASKSLLLFKDTWYLQTLTDKKMIALCKAVHVWADLWLVICTDLQNKMAKRLHVQWEVSPKHFSGKVVWSNEKLKKAKWRSQVRKEYLQWTHKGKAKSTRPTFVADSSKTGLPQKTHKYEGKQLQELYAWNSQVLQEKLLLVFEGFNY